MSITWTLPAPAVEAAASLVEHARLALPRRFTFDRDLDDLEAFAEIFAFVHRIAEHYHRLAYIDDSVGPWLRQHGKDRDTYPQEHETDAVFRTRVRQIPDAVSPVAVLANADAILAAAGVAGTATLVEPYCGDTASYAAEDPSEEAAMFYASGYDGSLYPSPDGIAYTIWNTAPCGRFIVYVPAATPDSVLAAIRDQIRIIKAVGIAASVERVHAS